MTTDQFAGKPLPRPVCKCGHEPDAHTWRGTGACGRLECADTCSGFMDASRGGFSHAEIKEMFSGGPEGRQR